MPKKLTIPVKDLKNNFYQFGNKGSVWSNETHIALAGSFSGETLCGTPMLSNNWAEITNHPEIGCPECIKTYKETQEL